MPVPAAAETTIPALPPGFKLDKSSSNEAIPTLPAGFKLDVTAKPEAKLSARSKKSLTGGLSKEQRTAQPKGYTPAEMASDAFAGPAAVMGLEGAAGAISGLGKAGAQLAKGAVGPALQAARPALGLAAGLGTGHVVNKAATYIGIPPWISDIIAEAAAVGVGAKVGMSSEMQAKLKSSGIKGVISELFNGETKEPDAVRFYRSNHPEAKGKLTEEQVQMAKVEANEFRRQAAARLRALQKEAEALPAAVKSEAKAPKAETRSSEPETNIASSRYAPTDKWGPAAAKLKNETMATYFKEQGIDADTVAKMTESELNAHLKAAGKGYKPTARASSRNQTHRTHTETRTDIAKAMKETN